MKQELKEIVGYLPYGVRANLNRNKGMFKSDNVDLRMCKLSYNNTVDEYYFTYKNVTYGIEDIKLILRPLSDLNKEIQKAEYYNSFLGHLLRECYNEDIENNVVDVVGLCYSFTDENKGWFKVDFSNPDNLPYNVIKWLYKHRFDIHNLIEQGKAINLNNLEV